jgi:DNA-binding XRE family transcriptional regulator
MKPKIINVKGKPHLVIISYQEYLDLLDAAIKPKQLYAPKPKLHIKKLNESIDDKVPEEVRRRVAKGESPVKAWRLYRDLTQSEVAKLAGISSSTLSLIENEVRHGTRTSQDAIALALDVPVRILFSGLE